MKTTIKLAVCAIAMSAVTAFAADKKADVVAVGDLPAAVTESVAAKWPSSTIANAKKSTKGEAISYKLKVKSGEEVYIAWVDADGTIQKSKEKEDKKK